MQRLTRHVLVIRLTNRRRIHCNRNGTSPHKFSVRQKCLKVQLETLTHALTQLKNLTPQQL